jgi:GNAT superfamily N-acetyltransferase
LKSLPPGIDFHPVTLDRLPDLDRFSREHGKFRYCSCMRWRLSSSQMHTSTKESRIAALEELVQSGVPVGVLGYLEGKPVGWCSIGPRTTFEALERSRSLGRLDGLPVWSVTCFFVGARLRRRGLTLGLLNAAVDYARSQNAPAVEAYPVVPGPRLYTYMGAPPTFLKAGFCDVTPPNRQRLVMRLELASGHWPRPTRSTSDSKAWP